MKFKPIILNIIYFCLCCLVIINAIYYVRSNHKLSIYAKETKLALQKLLLGGLYEELVELLMVYSAYDENGPLTLVRRGKDYDGGYVVAVKALEHADVLLGYGINTDNSFEDQFSVIYNKPSYGFDCNIQHIDSKSRLFTFVKECIVSESFLKDGLNTNNNISSFGQQLDKLGLQDKKLFIKMDIEGSEYQVLTSIMKHSPNITGIVLEIHFWNSQEVQKAIKLLRELQKDFVLIHVHGNNCCIDSGFSATNAIGVIPNVIELSYINKSLVTGFSLSESQSHPIAIDQPNIREKPEAVFNIMK